MAMPKLQSDVQIVPVVCPTRDEQGAVARSVAILWNVIYATRRLPCYIHASCVGYARVRTDSFKETQRAVKTTATRGFMIDDDILLTDEDALYDAVKIADRNRWNIVAPYRTKHGRVCICNEQGHMLTVEEFAKLGPYAPVPMAGLGFYYGDLPLEYEFHSDGKPFTGEDLNFWYDNPGLKPRVAPIPTKHLKVIGI
jgi:hypothetical protein